MMLGCVNGDVEIINILDYSGMVNVFVRIHLEDIFNIMIKDIRKTWEGRKEIYGEDNHFREELIGGGLIMVVVEIVYLLDQKQILMFWEIINMEDQIHNQKMEHMVQNHGQNVRMKDKRVNILV